MRILDIAALFITFDITNCPEDKQVLYDAIYNAATIHAANNFEEFLLLFGVLYDPFTGNLVIPKK